MIFFPFLWNEGANDLIELTLSKIRSEYDAFVNGKENDHCVYCFLKQIDHSLFYLAVINEEIIKQTAIY